jgi:hypothetical protein
VSAAPPEHVPGFWLKLVEADARAVASGTLPDRVRDDVADMLADYDRHLHLAALELEKRRTT